MKHKDAKCKMKGAGAKKCLLAAALAMTLVTESLYVPGTGAPAQTTFAAGMSTVQTAAEQPVQFAETAQVSDSAKTPESADGQLQIADLLDMESLTGFAAVPGAGRDTTTGGGNATPVLVDAADENAVSQLTDLVSGSTPQVIVIRGTISLTKFNQLVIGSNKTIVGVDENAGIEGTFLLKGVENVIISNLNFRGNYNSCGGDDCVVVEASHHVWLDHLHLFDSTDELLDIKTGADYVTVSWCRFHYTTDRLSHRLSCLVGSGTGNDHTDDGKLHVTFHHNWFGENITERMPRVLFGQAHIYNNYYTAENNVYGIGAADKAALLVENNYFGNTVYPLIFRYDSSPAHITQYGNLTLNPTWLAEGYGGGWTPYVAAFEDPPYPYTIDPAEKVPELVAAWSGPQNVLDGEKTPASQTMVTPTPSEEPIVHDPVPTPHARVWETDKPVTYDETTDTYTYHGENRDGWNGRMEIANPFRDENSEENDGSWREYAISCWVYLPEGSGDAPLLTFNLESDRQMSCFDSYKYAYCKQYDEYLEYLEQYDDYTIADTAYSMGSSDPVVCVDENGKTYTVLTDPGSLVIYNPECPEEGVYKKDATGAHFVYPQDADPADPDNWFAVSYVGEGCYRQYHVRFDEEGGENSRIREGYTSGSLCLYASGSVGFMQDDGTARNLNPYTEGCGEYVQIQPFNKYNYWGNGSPSTMYADRYQTNKTPTMETYDKWHFVVIVLEEFGVTFYIDGEEMTFKNQHCWEKQLNENNYYTAAGKSFAHGMYSAEWRYDLYQSGMTIPSFISDKDTRVYVGGTGLCTVLLGQDDIGTAEGVQVKNIAWYDRALWGDQIFWDGVDPEVKPVAGTPSIPSGEEKPTPEPTPTPTPEPVKTPEPVYEKGDTNKDGKISAADALCVLRIVVKLDSVTSNKEFVCADVNEDGKITAEDALQILQYVVHLTEKL